MLQCPLMHSLDQRASCRSPSHEQSSSVSARFFLDDTTTLVGVKTGRRLACDVRESTHLKPVTLIQKQPSAGLDASQPVDDSGRGRLAISLNLCEENSQERYIYFLNTASHCFSVQ